MGDPVFPPSYEDWAADHRALLRVVLALFMASGQWPTLNELQRRLVRDGERVDVGAAALDGIPRPLGFRQGDRLVLTLFGLRLVPEAAPLLDAFMQTLRVAAARYADPDDPNPVISDHDVPGGAAAQEIVGREAPFLGSTVLARDDQQWAREVDRTVARYLDITTIDDYLRQRRDELQSSPLWNWPRESPPQPRARFDARGALEFLLAAAGVVGLVLAAPLWLAAATAGAAAAYGLARSSRRAWAAMITVATVAWTGFSLAHASGSAVGGSSPPATTPSDPVAHASSTASGAGASSDPRARIVELTGSWSTQGFANAIVERDGRIVALYLKTGMKATTVHKGASAVLWGFQGVPQNGDPVALVKAFQGAGFKVDEELEDSYLMQELTNGGLPLPFDTGLTPKGYTGGYQDGTFVGSLLFWIVQRATWAGPKSQDMKAIKYLISQGADCKVPLSFLKFNNKTLADTSPYEELLPVMQRCAG